MTWRLRFHTDKRYLDLEGGRRKPEPEGPDEEEDGPAVYIPTPMTEDPRLRLGFHTTGGGGGSGFTTGDI